ncbi:helix-turn-helix transcriptional regulator [Agrobacterium rosae]|uniref:helix-turn-helix transcriptional regulator n=1 Tax=Agrobacterium rosae TaxID=1972867 RepID=UPI003BA13137
MTSAFYTQKHRVLACPLPSVLGLNREQAAAFIGISPSLFDKAVEAGTMPGSRMIGARKIWDVDELTVSFRAIPHKGATGLEDETESKGNAWDNARAEA